MYAKTLALSTLLATAFAAPKVTSANGDNNLITTTITHDGKTLTETFTSGVAPTGLPGHGHTTDDSNKVTVTVTVTKGDDDTKHHTSSTTADTQITQNARRTLTDVSTSLSSSGKAAATGVFSAYAGDACSGTTLKPASAKATGTKSGLTTTTKATDAANTDAAKRSTDDKPADSDNSNNDNSGNDDKLQVGKCVSFSSEFGSFEFVPENTDSVLNLYSTDDCKGEGVPVQSNKQTCQKTESIFQVASPADKATNDLVTSVKGKSVKLVASKGKGATTSAKHSTTQGSVAQETGS